MKMIQYRDLGFDCRVGFDTEARIRTLHKNEEGKWVEGPVLEDDEGTQRDILLQAALGMRSDVFLVEHTEPLEEKLPDGHPDSDEVRNG